MTTIRRITQPNTLIMVSPFAIGQVVIDINTKDRRKTVQVEHLLNQLIESLVK